jgi:TonB family protein
MTETSRRFGSCIVHKELSSDDLGHLFRAATVVDNRIDRTIWLRVLDGPRLATEAIIASFADAHLIGEAMTGAQVPSRPLFLESDGVPALGCDYVAGQPLNQVLARARDEAFPLQPENTLLIVEKIALALTAGAGVEVAGKPLAHGFLHPGLIYLSNDGEIVVTGFGVGRAFLSTVEEPGSAAGARAYLAPEILHGGRPSLEGDVYSLAAILFHLLTGTALPVEPGERAAALETAHTAWDGECLPADIQAILNRALDLVPELRFAGPEEFRSELDRLIYGGAYSPTTFNLALFMDRLFRSEIEADEVDLRRESEFELPPSIVTEPDEPEPEVLTPEPEPEAVPPTTARSGKRVLWAIVGGVAVIGIGALIFWAGRQIGPQQELTPTPTAEEIASNRQAQEDRLRTLTQEMVQQMMVEREEEIRQELTARQARIEELQLRLQRSEQRAARSAAAAATEAETQKALMREIEEQEEAQQKQQDALDAERQQGMNQAASEAPAIAGAATQATDIGPTEAADAVALPAEIPPPSPSPLPTRPPPRPTAAPAPVKVRFGDFVSPDEVDTVPVVLKSQSLSWPRSALRSKRKGVVVVKLTVNANGGIDDVEVLRTDDTGWGIPEAAVEAASGYRYKPATKDGVAVTTNAFVTWHYDFTAD